MLTITSHGLPDVDAVVSAYLLHLKFGYPIVFPEHPNHEAKTIAQLYSIPYSVKDDCTDDLILVDTNYSPFSGKVIARYDHHNCGDVESCDESSPSTAYLIYKSLSLPNEPPISDLVILSILSDTHRFKDVRNSDVFADVSEMLETSSRSYNEILSLLSHSLSYSERLVLARSFRSYDLFKDSSRRLIVIISDAQSFQSKVALHLVEGLEADLGIAYSIVDEELRVSARASPRFPVPMDELMRELANRLNGRGGGHPYAGATNLPKSSLKNLVPVILDVLSEKGLKLVKDLP